MVYDSNDSIDNYKANIKIIHCEYRKAKSKLETGGPQKSELGKRSRGRSLSNVYSYLCERAFEFENIKTWKIIISEHSDINSLGLKN